MWRWLSLLGLCSATLAAQIVPGRYVVELSTEPLGALARTRSISTEKTARQARIALEQRAAARMVEERGGRVLATARAVMNALMVDLGKGDGQWLAKLPGAAKVYPVEMLHANLDHALPLHSIPAAWAAVGGREHAGAGVKIAILDSGIAHDHPGFQDTTMRVPAGFPIAIPPEDLQYTNEKIIVAREYREFYTLREPDDLRDRQGHGTAVAMCAAGVPAQGPFGLIAGAAPKAWLGVYKISPLNTGSASSDVILKAVDDALSDGMDIISVSYGSALVQAMEDSASMTGLDRAVRFGAVVVVSAGNSGPAPGTIGNSASVPSVISVGASDSDRLLNPAVEVEGLTPRLALPRAGKLPDESVSGPLRDLGEANGCAALPEASMADAVALLIATGCSFETKLRNVQDAGARAAILHLSTATQSLVTMNTGSVLLPAVMVGFEDGGAFREAAAAGEVMAKISFRGVPFVNDPMKLRTSSSRGPTYSFRIKPDLAATGYVYSAAQSLDERGSGYDASGYRTSSGTSFSAPIVAGAAAVLKGARPGLTADECRSLLINRASPMDVRNFGLERVQGAGPGILNLEASLRGTVTAYPPSVSFGIGSGTADLLETLMLTNVGKVEDTYALRSVRYDGAAALRFADNARGLGAAETMTVTLEPGQSKPVYPFWKFERAPAGEYQGLILAEGTQDGASILIPYWYGVPSNVPASVTLVSGPASRMTAGTSTNIYFRVPDGSGIPVTDVAALRFSGSVTGGGGTIGPITLSTTYPNLVYTQIRTGPAAGTNTYRISFANLPALNFTVQGVAPSQ